MQIRIVSEEVAFGIKPDYGKGAAQDEFVLERQAVQFGFQDQVDCTIQRDEPVELVGVDLDDLPVGGLVAHLQRVEMVGRQLECDWLFSAGPDVGPQVVVLVEQDFISLADRRAFDGGYDRERQQGAFLGFLDQLLGPTRTARYGVHSLSPRQKGGGGQEGDHHRSVQAGL